MRLKITLIRGDISTNMKQTNFVDAIKDIFKARLYVILSSDNSPNIAINTDNILFIEEVF